MPLPKASGSDLLPYRRGLSWWLGGAPAGTGDLETVIIKEKKMTSEFSSTATIVN